MNSIEFKNIFLSVLVINKEITNTNTSFLAIDNYLYNDWFSDNYNT